MTRPTFVHIHASGLWDAPAERWQAYVNWLCGKADIVTLTEVTLRRFNVPRGWDVVWFSGAGRNECAVLFKTSVFERTDEVAWAVPISRTPYALGSGKVRPRVHLIGVELRHKRSGNIVNAEVFHTPSAVEGKGGLIKGVRRVTALLECFSGVTAHRKVDLRGEASFVAADWNLDHKKAWVRALLRSSVRGFRTAWRDPLPRQGNMHFGRLIDGVRFTKQLVLVERSRVLGRFSPFDHRAIRTEFGWRAAPR